MHSRDRKRADSHSRERRTMPETARNSRLSSIPESRTRWYGFCILSDTKRLSMWHNRSNEERLMRRYQVACGFVAVAIIAAGCLLYSDLAANAAAPEDAKQPDRKEADKPLLANFMRAKLTASSQVLEGLCTEDFGLITKGAKNLKKLSSAEKWRVSNDAMFRQHSQEFRTGVDRLLQAAEKKKIDGAALAWTQTTLNCIECHRWVKTMLIAGDGKTDLRVPQERK